MSTATELLRRTIDDLELQVGRAIDEIRAYLAAEPEAEPVAWLIPGSVTLDASLAKANGSMSAPLYLHPPKPEAEPACWVVESVSGWSTRSDEPPDSVKATCNCYPLYFYPPRPEPARKPMTEEEIDEELETNEYYCAKSFADGVRWAEKHHGIGGDDD